MIATGTIAAVASPRGRSPRAVVRLSGPDTRRAVERLASIPYERGARAARLNAAGLAIPALLLMTPAPRSYTGEDAAEMLLPGSPFIAELVMNELLAAGVRHAGPGEFSARAYLSGKLTLDQAEGVAASIAATSKAEAAAARRLLSGEAGDEARRWTERLAELLALVEAGVDFTDQEDVVPITGPDLAEALRTLRREIAARVSGPVRETPPDGPLVALAGAPSAGKSTLFNALLGRDRAVTDPEPGTTRDVLIETIEIRGALVRLADLAGLDDAEARGLDADARARALKALAEADAVVHCDPSGRFDQAVYNAESPTVRVRTKSDLLTPTDPAENQDQLPVCALDGTNLEPLREAIADAALGGADPAPRRRRALAGALAGIDAALVSLGENPPAPPRPPSSSPGRSARPSTPRASSPARSRPTRSSAACSPPSVSGSSAGPGR